MNKNVKISVVILAKNEEHRIVNCIKSVNNWANELLVIDDESSDNTKAVAESLGAKVIIKKMEIEGKHRNWSYNQAKNEWVLSLDCDERVTDELKKEINHTLANTKHTHFSIPLRNYIGNYWIRYGGWYPAAKVRLFRKDKFKYEETRVHPTIKIQGSCGHLKSDIIHYNFKDWSDYVKKTNNQTTLEAEKWYKLSFNDPKKVRYKMNFPHAVWRMFDRFFRAFIKKRGYKDGFIGFMVAFMSGFYQILSYAKFYELKKKK